MKSCKTIICISLISVSVSLLFTQCEEISFEKVNNSDWNLPENQDSLSPTVIITRKDNQSLFNIAQEDGYSGPNGSPVGTLWSHSSTQNSNPEDYVSFVAMHGGGGGPQSLINQTISLYLPGDGFYFDIVFSSYSGGNSGGGFSYTRTIVVGTNIGDVCDCDGNILACNGECGGTAYTDQCGECDDNTNSDCYDLSLELHEGANLISFPCLPEDVSVGNIFAGCDGVIGEGVGAVNIPDIGWIGSLTEVSQDDGYWVKVSEDTTIEVEDCVPVNYDADGIVIYEIHYGNNLISYPFVFSQAVGEALGDDAENVYALAGEGIATLWSSDADNWGGSMTGFESGKGYWLVANNDFVFIYNGTADGLTHSFNEVRAVPEIYSYTQSDQQAFFIVQDATINDETLESDDIIIAYNGDVILGSRYWNGEYTDIPAMGVDSEGGEIYAGYAEAGDKISFKVWDDPAGTLLDMVVSGNVEWNSMGISVINLCRSSSCTLSNNSFLPLEYSLNSPYPNPFNPVTSIQYSIPVNTGVELIIYDITGRQVQTLISDFQIAGYHSINWNASNYPSGVYLIRMDSGGFAQMQKVVLVK